MYSVHVHCTLVQLYSWLPIAMNVLSSTPMINSPSFICYINLPNYFIHVFIFIILLFILSILSVKTCDTKTVEVLYLGSRYLLKHLEKNVVA